MKRTFVVAPLLLIAAVVGLLSGAADVDHIWSYLLNPFFDSASTAHQIIWQIRAPRVGAAIVVGAALGIAGVLAQGSTNNPLADPAILGTSAGASLGVLIGVLTNVAQIGTFGAVICATIGALLVTQFVFSLAHSALQLITIGIGTSAIVTAVVGLVITAVTRPDARSISFWSFGSFALVTPSNIAVLFPVLVIGGVIAWKIAPQIDLLSLGDASVRHIGKNPQGIRRAAFAVLSLLVAATVSTVGSISFLALAAPHIARYIYGPRNRPLVIHAAFIGATILLVADTLSRSVLPPQEFPIGLITSLIGAPILIATLKRGGDVWR